MIQNRLEIKPDKVNEFMDLLKHHLKWTSENEPGCRRIDIVKDEQDDNIFHLYELYDDQGSLTKHAQSPTLAELRSKFLDWLVKQERFTGDLLFELGHS